MANVSGVNTHRFTTGMYDLVADALVSARKARDSDETGEDSDDAPADTVALDDYLGTYDVQPRGPETARGATSLRPGPPRSYLPVGKP